MKFMNLFRTQFREKALREIRQGFDDIFMEVIREGATESPMGGLIVKVAFANFYHEMKASELRNIYIETGVNFQDILDEECENAQHKHLEE